MRLFKKLFSFFWDRSLLIFLIIGGLNTLVSMVGSQLLYGALGYWGATALMFTVCSVFSFIFNRKYSFESKAPLLQSAVRFSVVIAVCYLISFGLSDFLVPMFMGRFFPAVSTDWQARIAMLVAQVIFTAYFFSLYPMIRYAANDCRTFKNISYRICTPFHLLDFLFLYAFRPYPQSPKPLPRTLRPRAKAFSVSAIGGAGPETGWPAAFSRRAPFHHSRRGAPAALKAPARVSSSS